MSKVMFKKCHVCGHINEAALEPDRCGQCRKSFLPSNYFQKIHAKETNDFKQLFSPCEELCEEDLVKGFHVLW